MPTLKCFVSLLVMATFLSSCGGMTPGSPSITYSESLSTPQPTQISDTESISTEIPSEKVEHLYDMAFSRDKKRVAVYTTKGIYIYDSITLTKNQFIEFKPRISAHSSNSLSPSITFSPDGNKLLFSDENRIFSWNLIDNQENKNSNSSFSAIPFWDIFKIEYSPKGDRIIVTTYGGWDQCDGIGINFALYDLEFNMMFDRYFCTANLENYYRFTKDNKVYIFFNARSMFFPIEFYDVDLSTGNVLNKTEYDLYSGNAKDFIYDISSDGQFLAMGNYKNSVLTTDLIDVNTGKTLQIIEGGIDLSLDGIGKSRKNEAEQVVNEKCSLVNKPKEAQYTEILTNNGIQAVYTISEWNPFLYWKHITSIELWNLSTCKVQKKISYP